MELLSVLSRPLILHHVHEYLNSTVATRTDTRDQLMEIFSTRYLVMSNVRSFVQHVTRVARVNTTRLGIEPSINVTRV